MKRLVLLGILLIAGNSWAVPPRPRENKFFKMEVAGLNTKRTDAGPALAYGFMFVLKQPLEITQVRVEDVSEKTPVLLLDDRKPKISNQRWNGETPARPITPENFPWMFDRRTTKKEFRVTVFALPQGEITLTQPAVFPAEAKKWMIQTTPKLKKSE